MTPRSKKGGPEQRSERRIKAPKPSSKAASAVMSGNRKTGSKPEVQVRSQLHRMGYRFRKNHPVETEERKIRPDIVFPGPRLAVFIDGCFWHYCPEHGNIPKTNRPYWEQKLRRNVLRDRQVDELLKDAGWRVLRIWEHVKPLRAAENIANRVDRILTKRDG